jgi:hypothetical protein
MGGICRSVRRQPCTAALTRRPFTNGKKLGRREEIRAEFYGELFPEQYLADDEYTFREFFQTDRDDVPKGVVRLDLKSLP